jgi:hypothetical protein
MKPTPKLRFIERDGPMMGFHKNSDGSETTMHQKIRILQQWWEQSGMTMNMGWGGEMPIGETKGEWRDVPMEAE